MSDTGFSELGDAEFFEERRRVREELEHLPPGHADRARLAELYDALNDELTSRAAAAWARAS